MGLRIFRIDAGELRPEQVRNNWIFFLGFEGFWAGTEPRLATRVSERRGWTHMVSGSALALTG